MTSVHDHDPRRRLWPIGLIPPALAPILLVLEQLGISSWLVAAIPLTLLFGIAPVIDHLIGQDRRNLSDGAIRHLGADPYYRRFMHGIVPAYAAGILAAAALAGNAGFSMLQWLIFTVGIAYIHSLIVLVAHELGHARAPLDRHLARLALALVAYGHFGPEHNINHHKTVATPDDPASARYNESIYRFARREMPGVLMGAVRVEKHRLQQRGHGWWSINNRLFHSWALSGAFATGLIILFGPAALAFYVLHNLVVWFSITMANYTAHYGLLRRVIDGRREPCAPGHSWSSSFLMSNLLFFNLQRHADHHAHARRPFQALRHLDNTPNLPAGIPGLFALMLIPPLWFRVMNPRLLAYVGGDAARINFQPRSDKDCVTTE